jgi:hypothetical protein
MSDITDKERALGAEARRTDRGSGKTEAPDEGKKLNHLSHPSLPNSGIRNVGFWQTGRQNHQVHDLRILWRRARRTLAV